MTDANAIANFHSVNNSASLKLKQRITGTTVAIGTKNVGTLVTLKNLISFWRTLEMNLINCEINLILTWSDKSVLSNDTTATTFATADTKPYVPIVTLSI